MSTTLTASLVDAIAQPGVEPRTLVTIGTAYGAQPVATELTRWSGVDYAGMLAEAPTVSVPLGNPSTGQLGTKAITLTLNNADGFWSKRPSSHYRGQPITVQDVVLGVESDALRVATYRATATRMPAGGATFVIEGEDAWSAARRTLVPPNTCLIDTRKYPNVGDMPAFNQPIPVVFGRCITPMALVDDHSSGYWRYVACVGTATIMNSGAFYELNNGILKPVASASGTNVNVFSLEYRVRNGVPVTEFTTNVSPYNGDGAAPRFADLVCNSPGHPDQVFLGLVTDSIYGAGLSPTLIGSTGLAEARSFYMANSLTFDCALVQQRPLEDWLGDWTHDAMTGILARDTLQLSHQGSRTAAASFHAGNIVLGTVEYTDAPETQENSQRVLTYVERSNNPGLTSFVAWAAGSGSLLQRVSPFIGRASVAMKAAQYWAKEAAAAVRAYGLRSTLRVATLEEGDVVTLTYSHADADAQLARVAAIQRTDGVYGFGLRRTTAATWDAENVPNDVPFLQQYRVVNAAFTSSGTNVVLFSSSHTLGSTPVSLVLRSTLEGVPGTPYSYTASMVSRTNSTFSVNIVTNPSDLDTALAFKGFVTGFDLYADPKLWGE